MDKLEKIMSENKESFLENEPSSGHVSRFADKLEKQNRKVKVISLTKRISRVAAVGLLALLSSLWAIDQLNNTDAPLTLSDINQKYSEVEFYLTSQIDTQYDRLISNNLLNDTEYQATLENEMKSMDSVYFNLQKELGTNPNDERIIQAMIGHYQTKLRVISQIITQLEEIENSEQSQINNQKQYESVKL